jgi:hypothetical protein
MTFYSHLETWTVRARALSVAEDGGLPLRSAMGSPSSSGFLVKHDLGAGTIFMKRANQRLRGLFANEHSMW